eukprot:2175940-Ditylum_brightwellii.AAC.1
MSDKVAQNISNIENTDDVAAKVGHSDTCSPPKDWCCRTNGLVDLVVADGGFDAQRDSDKQEILAQKMIAYKIDKMYFEAAAFWLYKDSC